MYSLLKDSSLSNLHLQSDTKALKRSILLVSLDAIFFGVVLFFYFAVEADAMC